jgi:putative tryptophan/tyrosine transport system substrate-binding protein
MRRREFIVGLGGAVASPLAARAQQPAQPIVGFINGASLETTTRLVAAFRRGLAENGYFSGQNVSVEYHWLEGQYDQLPALVADLVRRGVAVIATPGNTAAALAAKAATAEIPIVFGVGEDPIRLGLVASFPRPGGNATGINFFASEAVPKRLGLLRDLVPTANRVALLVNPTNIAQAEANLQQVQDAARLVGLPVDVFEASNSGEIEEAFARMARERAGALIIAGENYFFSRSAQLATLALHYGIATSTVTREYVEAGALMSYGADVEDMFHQVGVYTGNILKGAKPANLPVVQSSKFEFVINLQTAMALGLQIPPTVLALADRVIE